MLFSHRDERAKTGECRLITLIGHAYKYSGKYHLYFKKSTGQYGGKKLILN
jgi:hypothetical protein